MSNYNANTEAGATAEPQTGNNDVRSQAVLGTLLEVRDLTGALDATVRTWVHNRLARQLGKYAPQIERIDVRFGDENGPKGGLDRCCMVRVVLKALSQVVVEARAESDREAFDVAAGRAERATRRNMQKHGFSTKQKRRHVDVAADKPVPQLDAAPPGDRPLEDLRGAAAIQALQARPEKTDRAAYVDTAAPGHSADMRKVGYGHTGRRNTKRNTEGMTYVLESSQTNRPSRKSTRAASNRAKPASGLTIRTTSAVHAPQRVASRKD